LIAGRAVRRRLGCRYDDEDAFGFSLIGGGAVRPLAGRAEGHCLVRPWGVEDFSFEAEEKIIIARRGKYRRATSTDWPVGTCFHRGRGLLIGGLVLPTAHFSIFRFG
jgi:hypothetical protein